jgi:uncharacterized integral membrane protein (TIGR00697 family)
MHSTRFVVLAAVFAAALIASNLIAVKLISLGSLVLPAAVILFPVTYIVADVLTEVYGYSRARLVIWIGFSCNVLVVAAVWVAGALPSAAFWGDQEAWDTILGVAPRILAASLAAYLVGEFANAYVLARMKVAMQGRWLWARTIGSTVVGQALDSAIFVTLAFWGILPWPALLATAVTQWLVKTAYEAAATPLTYVAVGAFKRSEGIDVYDRDTRFNPLAMGR